MSIWIFFKVHLIFSHFWQKNSMAKISNFVILIIRIIFENGQKIDFNLINTGRCNFLSWCRLCLSTIFRTSRSGDNVLFLEWCHFLPIGSRSKVRFNIFLSCYHYAITYCLFILSFHLEKDSKRRTRHSTGHCAEEDPGRL